MKVTKERYGNLRSGTFFGNIWVTKLFVNETICLVIFYFKYAQGFGCYDFILREFHFKVDSLFSSNLPDTLTWEQYGHSRPGNLSWEHLGNQVVYKF